jgi:hypothetical protein
MTRYSRGVRKPRIVSSSNEKTVEEALRLRITVVDPPPNVAWALQLGRDELVEPTAVTSSGISFDFSVEVVAAGPPGGFRFRGAAVQGRPGERFVYLCVGTYAGQVGASASGRTKISLEGITRKLLDEAKRKRSGVLEARFAGTARDGGPARASVPLLGEGWRAA